MAPSRHGWRARHFAPYQAATKAGRKSRMPRARRREIPSRLGEYVEGAVDDLEARGQLLLGDAERGVRVDHVVGDEGVQAVVAEVLPDRLHLVGRAVERGEGRPG